MAKAFPEIDVEMVEAPDISHIVTEDDEPMDNIFSEKQQRLLSETLNGNWEPGRKFVAFSNVGLFYAINEPPVVPDMFLSLDVQVAQDVWEKKNRSYFVWEFGKPPEVAVEIVSNKKGGELDAKLEKYKWMRVLYYVVFDPQRLIQKDVLRIFKFSEGMFIPKVDRTLPSIGLNITLWEGEYEGFCAQWLRWTDNEGNLIPTGAERANREKERADQEKRRAEEEKERARMAEEKADKLLAMLRAAGIDP